VCYESDASCKFTCGHNFCHQCTKNWFQKGQSTCPMCRASMCFKGIVKMKKKWHREKQEETYKNLVNHIFDELMEDYDDIVLNILDLVQKRYLYTLLSCPCISCDDLDLVMRMTWVNVDYMLNTSGEIFYEPRTFEKYLMVSKLRVFESSYKFLQIHVIYGKNVYKKIFGEIEVSSEL